MQSQVAADLLCRHNRDKHHHEGIGQDRISHRLQHDAFLEMSSTSVMACRLCVAFSVVPTSKHKNVLREEPLPKLCRQSGHTAQCNTFGFCDPETQIIGCYCAKRTEETGNCHIGPACSCEPNPAGCQYLTLVLKHAVDVESVLANFQRSYPKT